MSLPNTNESDLETIISHAIGNVSREIISAIRAGRPGTSTSTGITGMSASNSACSGMSLSSAEQTTNALLNLNCPNNSDDDFQPESRRPHLPSIARRHAVVGRRRTPYTVKGGRRGYANSQQKLCTKDIVCLPFVYHQLDPLQDGQHKLVSIPRSKMRQQLCSLGLIGKLAICKSHSAEEVRLEISKLFRGCFDWSANEAMELEYFYLSCYAGTKVLTLPPVNNFFQWDGNAVLSLGRSVIYIAAAKQHSLTQAFDKEGSVCITVEVNTTSSLPTATSMSSSAIIPQSNTAEESSSAVTASLHSEAQTSSGYRNYVSALAGDCSTDDEDYNLQETLMISFNEPSSSEPSKNSPCEVHCNDQLQFLQSSINTEAVTLFNVNRRNVIDGAIRALKRKSFQPLNRIDVKFSDSFGCSEEAVDAGGPTREFLRLLVSDVMRSGIFEGGEACRFLTRNETASAKDIYYYSAICIGLSLLHGGPAPHCIAPVLFDQLVKQPRNYMAALPCMLQTMPYRKLLKIKEASTEDEMLQAIAEAEDYLLLSGCTHGMLSKPQLASSELVKAGIKFYVEGRVQAEVQRFADGLSEIGLLPLMISSPITFKDLFCVNNARLTASQIMDVLFKPQNMSPTGSNRGMKEEQAIAYWRDYVLDVEEGEAQCSLKELLIFATGAGAEPPLGFVPPPALGFTNVSKYPIANTCGNILNIPLTHLSYEAFKESMDFGVMNSAGFGLP